MTPPSEPIRPIGPLDGGIYVDRSRIVERSKPRGRRPKDDRDEPEAEDPADEQTGLRRPATPIKDPRAYDDHGRSPDDESPPDRPHIDAKA